MFSRIANYGGNTYFEYDFGGLQTQFVEVRSIPRAINDARWDLTLGDDKIYRQIVKNWSECVDLGHYFYKKDVINLRKHGILPEGYSLHHIHPRALGGNTLELKNMVLIPYDVHTKYHDFMCDFIIAKCLWDGSLTAPIPHGQKVFMEIPILPPVVSARDIPFAMKPVHFTKDIQDARRMIGAYLKKYPRAFSYPLFINGVIAKKTHAQRVVSWPPPRIQPTQAYQLHGTSQQATRFQPEHWSFNEWAAAARNRSRNYRT